MAEPGSSQDGLVVGHRRIDTRVGQKNLHHPEVSPLGSKDDGCRSPPGAQAPVGGRRIRILTFERHLQSKSPAVEDTGDHTRCGTQSRHVRWVFVSKSTQDVKVHVLAGEDGVDDVRSGEVEAEENKVVDLRREGEEGRRFVHGEGWCGREERL